MISALPRSRPVVLAAAAMSAAFVAVGAAPGHHAPGTGTPPLAGLSAVVDPALHAARGTVQVIVSGARSVAAAASAVAEAGGRVVRDLPLVGGVAARIPAGGVDRIARVPGITAITLDRRTHVAGSATNTQNRPSVFRKVTHADTLAGNGASGEGVTVALIDTGVTALPDIDDRLVSVATSPSGATTAGCANFTDEPTCDDSYGHGTFMAGLIAGTGEASNGKWSGMAPQANLLSVKIAGASGAADVSTIIAAIQWVVSFKDTYGIRVLNLSLGTDSTQSYLVDPLDYAVERAWRAGIVVDVAASNRGPAKQTITDPANDPFVLTVGAIDDMGTGNLNDDVLPDFSSRGPTASDGLAKPDVVAPGAHLVSLAAPGASITTQFPSTMPAPYRRGSGTSMANAVVSGLVADMLSAQPGLTPDRVKYALTATARPDASGDVMAVGAGVVDGWAALGAPPGLANQGVAPSMGSGSLGAARGNVRVRLNDPVGTVLDGAAALTQQARTWNPTALAATWSGGSWWGGSWWGGSWWGGSWWGGSWWGGSFTGGSWWGTADTTQSYGGSWWGGSWYGAWDQ